MSKNKFEELYIVNNDIILIMYNSFYQKEKGHFIHRERNNISQVYKRNISQIHYILYSEKSYIRAGKREVYPNGTTLIERTHSIKNFKFI